MIWIYLIRHGDSTAIGKILSGRAAGIHLTQKGETEIQALANLLKPIHFDAIYSSPMERTLRTAEALQHLCSSKIQIEDSMNEVDFGEWTGMTFDQLHGNPVWRQWFTNRSAAYAPGGETMRQVQDRAANFLRSLEQKHPHQHVAVISHGDVIRASVCYFLGAPLESLDHFDIDTGSATLLEAGAHFNKLRYLNVTGMLLERRSQ